jgi:hypothetical protein
MRKVTSVTLVVGGVAGVVVAASLPPGVNVALEMGKGQSLGRGVRAALRDPRGGTPDPGRVPTG